MSTVESQSSRPSSNYDSSSSGRREKNKRGEVPPNHHGREGYNSSTDPSVKSTHGERTSSNARHHPKAETTPTNASNHTHLKSHDRKRKPSNEETDDVWTEHKSSSGRIYFYNKRLDKSQWEKPTKGTVKKLRQTPDPRMSSSANKPSSVSKSHSHTTGTHSHTNSTGSTHHREGSNSSSSNNYHYDHHTPKRKISDRKYTSSLSSSSTHSKALKNTPETPIGNDKTNSILSPPTLPPPPPPPLPHNTTPTHSLPSDLSSPHVLPYMSLAGESIGPITPLQNYPGSWVPVNSEGTHPLQRTIMIQSQFSQGPQGSPRSLPTTPLQSFPPPTHLITPNNNNTLVNPQGNHGYAPPLYCYDQPRLCSSKKLQLPMSRLGTWPPKDDAFPDPLLLKPLPQLQSNDFFSNSLTLQWTSSIDGSCLKQADSAQLESLSRTTVDLSYHCGQLVRNLLALECCRMKTVSRRTRITNLTNTIDQIDKR